MLEPVTAHEASVADLAVEVSQLAEAADEWAAHHAATNALLESQYAAGQAAAFRQVLRTLLA